MKRYKKLCIVIKAIKQTQMNCSQLNVIECLRKQKTSAFEPAKNQQP